VNSKAILRWNIYDSQSLTLDMKAILLSRLNNQISKDGSIVISSDRFRDQIRNREDCIEKLHQLITSALVVPKKRKKTKPSRSSERRAKENKKRHSEKKSFRKLTKDFD